MIPKDETSEQRKVRLAEKKRKKAELLKAELGFDDTGVRLTKAEKQVRKKQRKATRSSKWFSPQFKPGDRVVFTWLGSTQYGVVREHYEEREIKGFQKKPKIFYKVVGDDTYVYPIGFESSSIAGNIVEKETKKNRR